jgi:3-hydroxybutyryl-CoA dehydrogenase
MKIVIAAGEILKQEMLRKTVPATVELTWIDKIHEIKKEDDADAYFDLEFEGSAQRIDFLKQFLPKPVFINSVEKTLSETGRSFIRINAWPTFLQRNICEVSLDETQKNNASKILDMLGWQYRFVPDVCGMISARIVAMIVNEAYYTFEENVSTKEEIDIAMKLGTNYPYGPFEWSEKIGLQKIYALLCALEKTSTRYSISKALKNEIRKM